jgi:hypothetical protein
MKKKLLICFIFLGIVTAPRAGTFSCFSVVINSSDPEKEIELHGSLGHMQPKSLRATPIEISISTSWLNVVFLNNIGSVDVVIDDGSGNLIYQKNVDTQTEKQLAIDIYSWDTGDYQIKFINSSGQFMYGTFEIE